MFSTRVTSNDLVLYVSFLFCYWILLSCSILNGTFHWHDPWYNRNFVSSSGRMTGEIQNENGASLDQNVLSISRQWQQSTKQSMEFWIWCLMQLHGCYIMKPVSFDLRIISYLSVVELSLPKLSNRPRMTLRWFLASQDMREFFNRESS